MRVNGCSKEIFTRHFVESFRVWRQRSSHKWTTDLGEWSGLVSK
jgi:hypothetical protein